MDEDIGKFKAWFITGRYFAVPWILANTLLGATLAGFDLMRWIDASMIFIAVLISAHYINAWRDYVRGVDRIDDGSMAKPYTAGSQMLPRGYISLNAVKTTSVILVLISMAMFWLLVDIRWDTFILYHLGLAMALTYTDVFKPKGFGEIALFLGHGFTTTAFAYAVIRPLDMVGTSAGIVLGLLAGMMYTIDQLQDVDTDFAKRIKNFAYLVTKAEIKTSHFFWFAITAVITIHLAIAIIGWIPEKTLVALFLLPYFHFVGVMFDYNFDRATLMGLLGMWMYPVLMAAGTYM